MITINPYTFVSVTFLRRTAVFQNEKNFGEMRGTTYIFAKSL